ncbi:MAG TPA: hypothetical protein VHM30_13075, partial [Gemmatimonadaceae bacterium]|nr:hypothetical protein [Gemmatimonadaceae bacterium]
MSRAKLWSTLLALALLVAAPAGAQRSDAVDRFVAAARAGTKRYQSQEAAIADGYKRVGVEFPAMGEHWVNLARIMEDALVPERPSVLIYVTVNGQPRLAGVAYTDLLEAGESPPASPAPGAWHEHNGAVDEESLPLGHHTAHTASSVADGAPRLSILHAWVWTANPDGMFVTDNWVLPFARYGLAPDASASRELAHALALAADDESYHLLMLRTSIPLTPREDAAAERVIEARRVSAARIAGALRGERAVSAARRDALVGEWRALWSDLER